MELSADHHLLTMSSRRLSRAGSMATTVGSTNLMGGGTLGGRSVRGGVENGQDGGPRDAGNAAASGNGAPVDAVEVIRNRQQRCVHSIVVVGLLGCAIRTYIALCDIIPKRNESEWSPQITHCISQASCLYGKEADLALVHYCILHTYTMYAGCNSAVRCFPSSNFHQIAFEATTYICYK